MPEGENLDQGGGGAWGVAGARVTFQSECGRGS